MSFQRISKFFRIIFLESRMKFLRVSDSTLSYLAQNSFHQSCLVQFSRTQFTILQATLTKMKEKQAIGREIYFQIIQQTELYRIFILRLFVVLVAVTQNDTQVSAKNAQLFQRKVFTITKNNLYCTFIGLHVRFLVSYI